MSLAMAPVSVPPKILYLCGTIISEKFLKRRASLPPRCITCSSSSSRPPQVASTTATHHQEQSSLSTSSDFANFKPPPPDRPVTPKDLATDLPFQYWYSYADLPPGIPKRRPKNNPALTFNSGGNLEASPSVEKGGRGGSGSGGLWQAVLAVDSGKNLDPPKVGGRRGRSGGGGGLWEANKGLLSTNRKEGLKRAADSLEEEEEDIPLSKKEVTKLIETCRGTSRQINIGWGGWSPSCVELVHLYWKRSEVCKIKCKGVVTLDMDAMSKKLEAETGGIVIKRIGGVVYLFRGRNYKYWRDSQRLSVRGQQTARQYPKRLPAPSNLTKEEVIALRTRGCELLALCKLGMNGVYLTLLDDVRKAFKTQDLVRVNCQGFRPQNFKILGYTLQAMVPCELISFEFEHILMWKIKDVHSSGAEVA